MFSRPLHYDVVVRAIIIAHTLQIKKMRYRESSKSSNIMSFFGLS